MELGGHIDPFLGKQPAVIPSEYANGWTPSPGPARAADRSLWPKPQQYVNDVIGRFSKDRRVLAWDLYNEPQSKSLPLLTEVFGWARQAKPSQPVTVDVWARQFKDFDVAVLANSDVITFHSYGDVKAVTDEITSLTEGGRPVICTEWMARQTGSTIANILPVFYDHHVGAFIWGLVNGKTQLPLGRKGRVAPSRSLAARYLPGGPHPLRCERDRPAKKICRNEPEPSFEISELHLRMSSHPVDSARAWGWTATTRRRWAPLQSAAGLLP